MTQTHEDMDTSMHEDREPTAAEIEAWQRENAFLPAKEATPEEHPALYNISAGMLFAGVVRPTKPELPDYVAIEMDRPRLEMARLSRVSWNLSGGPPPDTARGVGVGLSLIHI